MTPVRSRVAPLELMISLKIIVTRMSELVKEAGLRSAVEKRMGSNPIPSKEFLCSQKTEW